VLRRDRGAGESENDRVGLLHQLSTLNPHPKAFPINALVSVAGTPLGHQEPLDLLVFVRMIATARILMPAFYGRLSAGRRSLRVKPSRYVLWPRDSLFIGEKLLTRESGA